MPASSNMLLSSPTSALSGEENILFISRIVTARRTFGSTIHAFPRRCHFRERQRAEGVLRRTGAPTGNALAGLVTLGCGLNRADGTQATALQRFLRLLSRDRTVELARALVNVQADAETPAHLALAKYEAVRVFRDLPQRGPAGAGSPLSLARWMAAVSFT